MSEYLDIPLRNLEQTANDLAGELHRIGTILTNLESAMIAADGGGDTAAYKRAAAAYAHWDMERNRLACLHARIEDEIGIHNARDNCAWGDWVTGS